MYAKATLRSRSITFRYAPQNIRYTQTTGDLKALIENGAGYGSINDSKSVGDFLNKNVRAYYDDLRFVGGGSSGPVDRNSALFPFQNTVQGFEGDKALRPDGTPYNNFSYADYYNGENGDTFARTVNGRLNNELNCIYTSKINVLKSAGLVRPDATVYEAAAILPQDFNQRRNVIKDDNIVFLAKQSDWAKLTGASTGTYVWSNLGQLDSATAQAHLRNGSQAVVHTGGHVLTVHRSPSTGMLVAEDPLFFRFAPSSTPYISQKNQNSFFLTRLP